MSELVLYIIIAIIWAIIGLIGRAAKEGNKSSKNIKKSVKKYQNKKTEDEEEIFRKLNKTINNEREFDKPNSVKVYETSYKDKEMLELQKKYDSIINDSRNITESINKINFASEKSDKKVETNNINNVLSSLNVRNAIIYNAILEPKRLNYKRIKKS